jgi:hypothetical protein
MGYLVGGALSTGLVAKTQQRWGLGGGHGLWRDELAHGRHALGHAGVQHVV